MPISRYDKIVFVHIPKTGGSSIEQALGIFGNNSEANDAILFGQGLQHLSAMEIEAKIGDLANWTVFTVMRDPLQRFLSHWRSQRHHYVKNGITITELVSRIERTPPLQRSSISTHLRDQWTWLSPSLPVQIIPNLKIFSFDNYDHIQNFLTKTTGRAITVPHSNSTVYLYPQPLLVRILKKICFMQESQADSLSLKIYRRKAQVKKDKFFIESVEKLDYQQLAARIEGCYPVDKEIHNFVKENSRNAIPTQFP